MDENEVGTFESVDEAMAYGDAKEGESGAWQTTKTVLLVTGTTGGIAALATGIGYGIYTVAKR
jgi:hypothetical protein